MKKMVVVSSSLRVGSNSEILAKEFMNLVSTKFEVSFINLKDLNFQFCKGCLACSKTGKCIIKDDISKYLDIISSSDALCFATPIYYYGMSGQLKTFLDRLNPLFIKKNNFKDVYLIATCADEEKSAINKTEISLSGWIECFEGVKLKGSFIATSLEGPNSVTDKNIDELKEFTQKIC